MKIEHKHKVRDGYFYEMKIDPKWEGKELWVTDYRHRNATDKPVRHVVPTKVLYTMHGYFLAINKNGEVGKRRISNTDNTCDGAYLKVFTTEEECREEYRRLCNIVQNQFNEEVNRLQINLMTLSDCKRIYGYTS